MLGICDDHGDKLDWGYRGYKAVLLPLSVVKVQFCFLKFHFGSIAD